MINNNEIDIKEKCLENEISITSKQMEYINHQMKNSICKIQCNGYGTGFFCYISISNDFQLLPVLITNYQVLKKNDIKQGKKIKLSIFNNCKFITIYIDEKRKIYISEKYDITIIEIKKSDYLDMDIFMDIDEDLYEEDININYKQKLIYLLYYPQSKNITYSLGIIKNISEDNYNIEFLCNNNKEIPEGPLFNLNNYKIIGISKRIKNNNNMILGTLINIPFEDFLINNNNNNDNNNDNDIDEIKIIYKYIKSQTKIKLFGEKFVENNKDKSRIIINGEEKELNSFYNFENMNDNELFEIKLKGIKNIIDMSYMFSDCTSLISLPDISEWNTININNMSHMFDGCKLLSNLSDISKWNTNNVTDMSYMFKDCESLLRLPDFTKWNTKNLINISYIYSKSLARNIYNIKNIKPIKMLIKDIPQIQEIYISYWGSKTVYVYSELERIINYNLSFGYKIKNELIGFCLCDIYSNEDIIEIALLCIKKEYKGKHLGKSILNFCIKYCTKLNYNNFALHVSINNIPALNLYKKQGFVIKELIKQYYEDEEQGNNDAYYMVLNN